MILKYYLIVEKVFRRQFASIIRWGDFLWEHHYFHDTGLFQLQNTREDTNQGFYRHIHGTIQGHFECQLHSPDRPSRSPATKAPVWTTASTDWKACLNLNRAQIPLIKLDAPHLPEPSNFFRSLKANGIIVSQQLIDHIFTVFSRALLSKNLHSFPSVPRLNNRWISKLQGIQRLVGFWKFV